MSFGKGFLSHVDLSSVYFGEEFFVVHASSKEGECDRKKTNCPGDNQGLRVFDKFDEFLLLHSVFSIAEYAVWMQFAKPF